MLRDSLLRFTAHGEGYREEEQSGVFDQVFGLERGDGVGLGTSASPPLLASRSISPRSASPSEASSTCAAVSLAGSLDDAGLETLRADISTSPAALTPSTYTPDPLVLASQPPAHIDPNALYAPLTTSRFKTSAAAKAHRKRARLPPKSHARDVARVKDSGRDYWVVRIYNAMINSRLITDGGKSVHRVRFTKNPAFDPVDLEAAAHAVFDEAIAVHERGWNRPRVYYKNTVRGKLVDVSGGSVELRLSRICVVLAETKSAVDDAVRGGVTLALLCDNPEARRFTKESNNVGNLKRGERLRQTSSRARSKAKEEEVDIDGAEKDGEEGESQEVIEPQEVFALQETEE